MNPLRRSISINRVLPSVLAITCMVTFLLAGACSTAKVKTTPDKPRDETLIKVTLACSNIEAGVKLAISVKRQLLSEGKISKVASAGLTKVLLKVTAANDELNARSLEFDTFSLKAQNDLSKLFDELQTAVGSLEANGTLPTSPAFNQVIGGVRIGVSILKVIFPPK
jgi:hypothetical protein